MHVSRVWMTVLGERKAPVGVFRVWMTVLGERKVQGKSKESPNGFRPSNMSQEGTKWRFGVAVKTKPCKIRTAEGRFGVGAEIKP